MGKPLLVPQRRLVGRSGLGADVTSRKLLNILGMSFEFERNTLQPKFPGNMGWGQSIPSSAAQIEFSRCQGRGTRISKIGRRLGEDWAKMAQLRPGAFCSFIYLTLHTQFRTLIRCGHLRNCVVQTTTIDETTARGAHCPPLLSILLMKVQSLENKLDDPRARLTFQLDIRN